MRLATINFWGAPSPLSIDRKDRLIKLINVINRYDLDVIALQEMWMKTDIVFLESKLTKYHALHYSKKKYNSSGLMILSRYPFVEKKFIPARVGDYAFWTKKGLLMACIESPTKYYIINTHLYCTLRPLKSVIWKNQVMHLLMNIPKTKSFVLGDFNYNYDTFPIPGLKIISRIDIPTRNKSNYYTKRRLNKFGLAMKCDLILSNFDAKIVSQDIVRKPILSDHYPVISEIKE